MTNKYSAPSWDDMQVFISSIKLPASSAPTWRDWDHGIVGGVTFPVLGFGVGEYYPFAIQTSHSMILNSILDNHIHFSTPTDGTGDKFKFQLDVIAAGIEGAWAVPSGSPFTAEHSITADYSTKHKLFELGDIPAVNTTVSSIYKMRMTRIAASADEYSGEVYIHFNDSHFQKDGLGSDQETSKS